MKFFLLILLFSQLAVATAEVAQDDVEGMINQMVRENVISATEAEKTKIRMRAMNKDQWKNINQQAAKIASRGPASVGTHNKPANDLKSLDLDSAQFKQIQDDIKKIVPEYRDLK